MRDAAVLLLLAEGFQVPVGEGQLGLAAWPGKRPPGGSEIASFHDRITSVRIPSGFAGGTLPTRMQVRQARGLTESPFRAVSMAAGLPSVAGPVGAGRIDSRLAACR